MVWVGQPPDIEPSTHTHSCALQLPLRAKRETERAMGVGRWGIAGVGRHTREKRAAREWSTMPNRDRERERDGEIAGHCLPWRAKENTTLAPCRPILGIP